MREALGGWEISPIATWQSGAPFSIGGGNSNIYKAQVNGTSVSEPNRGSGCLQACAGDRADRVPGVPLKVRQGGRSSGRRVLQSRCVCRSSRRNLRQQDRDIITDLRASISDSSSDEELDDY